MGNENWGGIDRRHEGWDGIDRRQDADWLQYKQKVLSDINDTKQDVKDIKTDVTAIKLTLAEFKVEIKQIISSSATRTSSYVSLAISVISGVILYFLIGKADG